MKLQGMENLKWGDDEWTMRRQSRMEALGNAVNVDMVEMIARRALSVYMIIKSRFAIRHLYKSMSL